MIRAAALSLLLLSFQAVFARDGGRAGNGFAVACRADEAEGIQPGYYSLDYLLTLGLGRSTPVKSWEESATRIRRILERVLSEEKLDLYDDFVANVRNTKDYTKKRIWEAAPHGVVNLRTIEQLKAIDAGLGTDSEQIKSNLKNLVIKLPKACQTANGDTDLVPAVVFQDSVLTGRPDGYLLYRFVPKVLNELEINDPLQLSYLYIHEWLWDISNNEDRNRRINHLLHSERIESLSPNQIREQLSGMGLDLGSGDWLGFRPRSIKVREALVGTALPLNTVPQSEILDTVMNGEDYLELQPYRLYAISRECEREDDCTEWKLASGKWTDFGKTYPIPNVGKMTLRREGNLKITLSSEPVQTPQGMVPMVTECEVYRTESAVPPGKCRRAWGPEGALKPVSSAFFDGVAPELTPYFQGSQLWIGGQAKRGKTEVRVAIVARYSKISAAIQGAMETAKRIGTGATREKNPFSNGVGGLAAALFAGSEPILRTSGPAPFPVLPVGAGVGAAHDRVNQDFPTLTPDLVRQESVGDAAWKTTLVVNAESLPDFGELKAPRTIRIQHFSPTPGTVSAVHAEVLYRAGSMERIRLSVTPPNAGASQLMPVEALAISDCGPNLAHLGECKSNLATGIYGVWAPGSWDFVFALIPRGESGTVKKITVYIEGVRPREL